MNILFVTSSFQKLDNGPAKFAKILTELNSPGNSCHILTEDIHESSEGIYFANIHIPFWAKPFGFVYRMIPYYREVLKLMKSSMYDIIWFNNVIIGFWTAWKLRDSIGVVGMINDDNSIQTNFQNFRFSKKWFRHIIFKWFEKKSITVYRQIVVNSSYLLNSVLTNYHFDPTKVQLLYKAVQGSDCLNEKYVHSYQGRILNVLFIKSDFMRGGLLDLLNALSRLHTTFNLFIVGPPKDKLESFLTDYNLRNVHITMTGLLRQDEIFKLMCSCDIFCIPSRQEALGVANMEALIHKLPVVYTEIGGVNEVMDDGRNGFAAKVSNPESLSISLLACIEQQHDRILKVEQGYEFVSKKFNNDVMLHTFIKIARHAVNS